MNCIGKMAEFTSDEIKISNIPKISICERTFEIPKNEEYAKALKDAFSVADSEVSIVQYIFNSGRLKKSCWNGHCSGGAAIKDKKTTYSFTLRVKDDKIIGCGQIIKYVYKDKISTKDLSKRERILRIHNFDNTNIVKTFVYGNLETKKYLEFYPSGKLKHCGIALSNKYFRGYWDENGNLINEIVRIKDWDKARKKQEKRRAEYKKKSDERIQAGKDYMEKHPELKKKSDKITETLKQLETIHKKLESESCSKEEVSALKTEQKEIMIQLKKSYSEYGKKLKEIQTKEEKNK